MSENTVNFARTELIKAIHCLIDVHGSNGRLSTNGTCQLEDNESMSTSKCVCENNIAEDLVVCSVFKNTGGDDLDTYPLADCYNTYTKKYIAVRLAELSLSNLERILSFIL